MPEPPHQTDMRSQGLPVPPGQVKALGRVLINNRIGSPIYAVDVHVSLDE
jgi:hypothetical protein